MRKTEQNLSLLNGIFVTGLIIANIVAGKVCDIFGLTVPAAIVAYAITFLCTDVIGEIWGKAEANHTVRLGLVCQLSACALILLAGALPYAPFAADSKVHFDAVLGQNFRFVVASMVAYVVSQSWDVFVFHRLKKKTGMGKKWLRNNLSTMTSQLFDTAIFITIGFWGTVPDIWSMIAGQYVIKVILAALDTPFFYLLTRRNR